MTRVDRASRHVSAAPARVFAALIDPAALTSWLPPEGMSGSLEHFDARPGGSYRMVLAYGDAAQEGKSGQGVDVVDVRFVEITPDSRLVQAVDFVGDDPDFTGTMTMTWSVAATSGGAWIEVRASGVPVGIDPADHATGMASTLENLAAYLDAAAP